MDELIPIVNSLQDAFASTSESMSALDLPQIAVVGNQSAGKSSVLENIVGRDFLPRGSGIVTRRPLILQLVHDPTAVPDYGRFLHRREQTFTDFEAIRSEIAAETGRVAGAGKAVSPAPINLRLHSPAFLDLTLVDLPGMTKVPVDDQPADIEAQILAMLESFVQRPNCLILAVCPANADLATSDALRLAQKVDPDGLRTIGVLTKVDLMDEGTHAGPILANELIPLRLGFSAVINRSQADIQGRKDIAAALVDEAAFFDRHPIYAQPSLRRLCGTANLRSALSRELARHIAATLPSLRSALRGRLAAIAEELAGWRSDIDYADEGWRPKLAVRLGIQFAESFREQLLGAEAEHLSLSGLNAGARICLLFNRRFREAVAATEWTQEALMKRQIGYAIKNGIGIRAGMFVPNEAFDRIIREQIGHLREPLLGILDSVEAEMMAAIGVASESIGHAGPIHRFPLLGAELKRRLSLAVGDAAMETRQRVQTLLDWEYAYINTKHEDFVTFSVAFDEANRRVRRRRNPGETVKKEGWLHIANLAMVRKRAYFVLTMEGLSWFTDETKAERHYTIPLTEELSLVDGRGGGRFILQSPANIVKDKASLELAAASDAEAEDWRRCFLQVGIFPTGGLQESKAAVSLTTSGAILEGTADAELERQIESLWILVDSYMRIVAGTLMDLVPKCIARSLVRQSADFAGRGLISQLSCASGLAELMEEDETELRRKRELEAVHDRLAQALERLSGLDLPAVPLPPAVRKPPSARIDSPRRPPPPRPASTVESQSQEASVSKDGRKLGKVAPQPRPVKSSRELRKALQSLDSTAGSQFYSAS